MKRHVSACLLIVAALLMGAEAPGTAASSSMPETDRVFSTVLQKPRLYAITATGQSPGMNGAKMCVGGDAWKAMFKGLEEVSKDPKAVAELSKGCATKVHRDNGSFSLEQICDEAKGAITTSRSLLSGTMDEVHRHMEIVLPGLGPHGADKTVVRDSRMTYIGDCPAEVKPGQLVQANGEVLDLTAMSGGSNSH